MSEWIKTADRLPPAKARDVWTWNGKSVGTLSTTSRIAAEDLEGKTHWMLNEPPKPPEPPND